MRDAHDLRVPPEPDQVRLLEAERHQRILSEVSRALLDYVGPDEVEPLRRIVDMVARSMGDWCTFSLVDKDGLLQQVAAWHPDPAQRALADQAAKVVKPQPWDGGPKEFNALLLGKPIAIEHVTDEMLKMGSRAPEEYEILKSIGMTSVI